MPTTYIRQIKSIAARRIIHVSLAIPLLMVVGCKESLRQDSPTLESRLPPAGRANGAANSLLRSATAASGQRDAEAQDSLAIAAEREGRDAEALQFWRNAIALQGPTPQRLTSIGRLELRAGNPDVAVTAYAQARSLAPTNVEAVSGLGLAYDLAGNYAKAQDTYRAGLNIAPRDWNMRSNLAMSLILSADPQGAIEILSQAEYAADAPRRARHNLALALVMAGQRDRAVRLLRLDMGPAEATSLMQQFAALAAKIDPKAVVQQSQVSRTPANKN